MTARERALKQHALKTLVKPRRTSYFHSKHKLDDLKISYSWEYLDGRRWDHKFGFWGKNGHLTIYFHELVNANFSQDSNIVTFDKAEFKLFKFRKQDYVYITTFRGLGFEKHATLLNSTFVQMKALALDLAEQYMK